MKKILFPYFLLTVLCNQVYGGSYLLFYGSVHQGDINVVSLFGDSWGNLLSSNSPGIITAGYFEDGFDIHSAAPDVQVTGLTPILDAFTPLITTSTESGTSSGFLEGSGVITDQGTGKKPYILLFEGILSFEGAQTATAIGIFTDDNLSNYPVGSDLLPEDFDIRVLSYNTIVLGSQTTTSEPIPGNVFLPISLQVPPSYLANSSNIENSWWQSDWFGLFYKDTSSHWIYHQSMGWLYPIPTQNDGIWLWNESLNQWFFINENCFPYMWAGQLDKWVYLLESSGSVTYWQWDSENQKWDAL